MCSITRIDSSRAGMHTAWSSPSPTTDALSTVVDVDAKLDTVDVAHEIDANSSPPRGIINTKDGSTSSPTTRGTDGDKMSR